MMVGNAELLPDWQKEHPAIVRAMFQRVLTSIDFSDENNAGDVMRAAVQAIKGNDEHTALSVADFCGMALPSREGFLDFLMNNPDVKLDLFDSTKDKTLGDSEHWRDYFDVSETLFIAWNEYCMERGEWANESMPVTLFVVLKRKGRVVESQLAELPQQMLNPTLYFILRDYKAWVEQQIGNTPNGLRIRHFLTYGEVIRAERIRLGQALQFP